MPIGAADMPVVDVAAEFLCGTGFGGYGLFALEQCADHRGHAGCFSGFILRC